VLRIGAGDCCPLLLTLVQEAAPMPDHDLTRRASAEAVGTALLVAVVVGSGIAAQRLSPTDTGIQLLENALATGAALVALILAIGPISGAHFNPVVTLADRVLGGTSTRDAGVYIAAQVVGGCVGAIVANLMFDLDAVSLSTHDRSSSGLLLGEFVATFGLLVVILGVVRAGRAQTAAFAVGGYIAAAYWFTSSTSFANPAVTIARTLSNTFAGIEPSSAPAFIGLQIAGGLTAVVLVRYWRPNLPAIDLVMPHDRAGTE
jgi:glycerol uptake facilitator-like aquaporin